MWNRSQDIYLNNEDRRDFLKARRWDFRVSLAKGFSRCHAKPGAKFIEEFIR